MELELFTDYFQFYIQDESQDGDLSDCWTKEATKRLLAFTDGTIGIGTVRNMNVPVQLEILSQRPDDLNIDTYDQINECSIQITSNKLVIAGYTDYFPDARRIKLDNGWYRVLICYANLTELSDDGLDGNDRYEIRLWKDDSEKPLKVLKQWKEADSPR